MSQPLLAERLAPQDVEAEEALIGSVLIGGPEVWPAVEHLQAKDFFVARNGWIWEALLDLAPTHGLDIVTVSSWLREHNRLDGVGGPAYLTKLMGASVSAFHAQEYAAIVEEKSRKRAALALLSETAHQIYSANGNLGEVTARAAAALDALAPAQGTVTHVALAAWDWYAGIEAYAQTGAIPGLTTGYPRLDKNTHGLKRGQVCILGGRPSMGKSALAFQIAHRQARAGLKVGILSLEMPAQDVAERIALAELNLDKFKLTAADLPSLERFIGGLDALPLMVSGAPLLTPAEIGREARDIARYLSGLDCLVIDHLGYVAHPAAENENLRQGKSLKAIARLAREMDLAILLLCQLNRDVTARAVKEPDLPDLRESGHIEQDARQVWFIHRDDYYKPIGERAPGDRPQKAMLLIRKNHNGPTGRGVPLAFVPQSARFTEWSDEREEPDARRYPEHY